MPERIKPIQDMGPCSLDLKSLQEITDLVNRSFATCRFSATDGTWEIYDETKERLLDKVAQRESLQSFSATAGSGNDDEPLGRRHLRMIFDEYQATINFIADPGQREWFEHFMFDLRKHIHPARFSQRLAHAYGGTDFTASLFSAVFLAMPPGRILLADSSTPYTRIVIKEKEPNPLTQAIGANLISSLIWAIVVIFLTFFAQWVLSRFGIDLTPWD